MNNSDISPLGSVLLFNATDLKFIDTGSSYATGSNKHDFAKGVDISLKEAFIKNGADNFFPFHLVDAVKRSTIQKRAFKTITSVAAGDITFVSSDGKQPLSEQRYKALKAIYSELGITQGKFLRQAISSAYLFGSCPVSLSFASNGKGFVLSKVKDRDLKTFRLGTASMKEGDIIHDKHFYHQNWGWREESRSKKVKINEKKTLSWLEWDKDPIKNADNAAFMYSYDAERPLKDEINRTQSYFIGDLDGLTDFYPLPTWFSGAAFNYIKADFLLSCFDIDEIENGFQAHGTIKVFHKSYKNPESGEAKDTFEKHKKLIAEQYTGGYKSGALNIVPVGIDGEAVNDSMEFIPTPSTAGRERYTILGERINTAILSANGAIFSELFGIRNESNALSESPEKLINGLKILNQFTIKPLKALFDDPESGFLNMVNDMLGIEERALIVPNLAAFLNLDPTLAMHFLHPNQWFEMYKDFGLEPPSKEEISSGLIPAFSTSLINLNSKL